MFDEIALNPSTEAFEANSEEYEEQERVLAALSLELQRELTVDVAITLLGEVESALWCRSLPNPRPAEARKRLERAMRRARPRCEQVSWLQHMARKAA